MNSQIKTLLELLDRERKEHKEARREADLLRKAAKDHDEEMRWQRFDLERTREERDNLRDDLRIVEREAQSLRDELRRLRIGPPVAPEDLDMRAICIETDGFIHKIPFIKAVRERTGLGLKESKDLVDTWLATHDPFPEESVGVTYEASEELLKAIEASGLVAIDEVND